MNDEFRAYIQPTVDGESRLLISDVPDKNLQQKTGRFITAKNPVEVKR